MTLAQTQQELISEFAMFSDWQDRYEHLIELGKDLPLIAPEHKTDDNLVRGCQSRVWLHASPRNGHIHFTADSDAMITKGIVALLVRVFNDRTTAASTTSSTRSGCARTRTVRQGSVALLRVRACSTTARRRRWHWNPSEGVKRSMVIGHSSTRCMAKECARGPEPATVRTGTSAR